MSHLTPLLLLLFLPACLQPTPASISPVDTSNADAADATNKVESGPTDGGETPDDSANPGPWTDPSVVASGPVDDALNGVVPFGFVDDNHLLFATDVVDEGYGVLAGELALIDVHTKAVHPLGFGQHPFEAGYSSSLRPVMSSPDGALWLFGDRDNVYLRNIKSPSAPLLDLGQTLGQYAMNAAGTVVVTLHERKLRFMRTDGSVLRGLDNVKKLHVSADRSHVFWVTEDHLFADDFDEDAGVVDAAVGPANDNGEFEELAGGKYLHYTLPNDFGNILYDVANRQIAMDTSTAPTLPETARDLTVINGNAVWRTSKTDGRVWVAELPGGEPQKLTDAERFIALPQGLLLFSPNGKTRLQHFADGSEGPDVSAWGNPLFGPFLRSSGSVLMATGDYQFGVPRVGSWVDLSTGTLQAVPEPTLMHYVPLFIRDDLFTYLDDNYLVSTVSLSTGAVHKAGEIDERRAKPVLTDDGRVLVRSSEGLILLGADLQPVVLDTEQPEFMRTRGDFVAFARTSNDRRELVLMRLPAAAP